MHFLRQTFLYPKIIFLRQNLFTPKNFTPKFSTPKFFYAKIYLRQNNFSTPKSFLYAKNFYPIGF